MISRELRAMRNMAWERAKGEINAMLQTYHGSEDPDDEEKFNGLEKLFGAFVKDVEGNGWQE